MSMLLVIFIVWMVVNVGLLAFVIVHPPRRLTPKQPTESPPDGAAIGEVPAEHHSHAA